MLATAMQPAPMAANDPATENLAQQMLTLVEIAATQDRQIQALKTRCERLELREQAGMVAFTAFFHILDANKVSDLAAMAGVFGSLIDQAQQLDLPEELDFVSAADRNHAPRPAFGRPRHRPIGHPPKAPPRLFGALAFPGKRGQILFRRRSIGA